MRKTKAEADFIYRNAKKLNRLVDELLDISRIEAGEMKVKACSFDLVTIVKENLLYFYSLAERKNITLKFNPTESKILVFLDKNKVDKIFGNILSNAFKFTPEGGQIEVSIKPHFNRLYKKCHSGLDPESKSIQLTNTQILNSALPTGKQVENNKSSLSVESKEDDCVEIEIRDTGIGIPQNRIDKIFDRFYQVDGSNTRERGGTGIGLSLTKELVELHKGRIEAISEEGKGSTFRVFFLLGKEHLKPEDICEEEIVNTKEQDNIEFDFGELLEIKNGNEINLNLYYKLGKPSLLIIEDNADVRNYIKLILETQYNIFEAFNGEEGLKKSFDHIPDLIISDIMMPKLDGFKLCEILKTDARTSHIPLIILTAKSTMQDKISGLELGADEYIMKPFEELELKARIQNLLVQRKRLHDHFNKYGFFEIEKKNKFY